MIYKAVVENNRKNGNVQVRVFGVHSQNKGLIPTEALPWAEVQGSTSFGLIDGVGVSSVLRIDTWVYVMFEGGDVDRPIVTGVVIGDNDLNTKLTDDTFTDIQTIKTKSGHLVEFNDTEGEEKITITHKSGTLIEFDKDGNINVDAVTTNLGVGGKQIARLDDIVEVTVVGGSSAGKHAGVIKTCLGVNTSI